MVIYYHYYLFLLLECYYFIRKLFDIEHILKHVKSWFIHIYSHPAESFTLKEKKHIEMKK